MYSLLTGSDPIGIHLPRAQSSSFVSNIGRHFIMQWLVDGLHRLWLHNHRGQGSEFSNECRYLHAWCLSAGKHSTVRPVSDWQQVVLCNFRLARYICTYLNDKQGSSWRSLPRLTPLFVLSRGSALSTVILISVALTHPL